MVTISKAEYARMQASVSDDVVTKQENKRVGAHTEAEFPVT